ncbi:hypothetical protein AQI84_31545 [Streptomyces griseorubiginosus]|nr:hypothetical protein AQI84_31545 [Streptomyces griseorubiginosus]
MSSAATSEKLSALLMPNDQGRSRTEVSRTGNSTHAATGKAAVRPLSSRWARSRTNSTSPARPPAYCTSIHWLCREGESAAGISPNRYLPDQALPPNPVKGEWPSSPLAMSQMTARSPKSPMLECRNGSANPRTAVPARIGATIRTCPGEDERAEEPTVPSGSAGRSRTRRVMVATAVTAASVLPVATARTAR